MISDSTPAVGSERGPLDGRASAAEPVIHIRPRRGWTALNLGEVWGRRELLMFLVLRDVKVRYRQSILGIGWALLQPLMTMIVFTFVFHRVAGIQSDGVPYAVFSFSGLLPWLLFQAALVRSSESMVNHADVFSKVYFPRLLIPLSSIATALCDCVISFSLLLLLLAVYRVPITWRFALVPVFMAYAALAALSIGLWLTAFHARYRDVGQLLPFVVRLAVLVSPVAYPLSTLTDRAPSAVRWLLACNPMASAIEGFRWAVLGSGSLGLGASLAGVGTMSVLLIGGLYYFRRVERTLVDVI